MKISPQVIKKALDSYDKTMEHFEGKKNEWFMIERHEGDAKRHHNPYSENPSIVGLYILAGHTLYYGEGEWITLNVTQQVPVKAETMLKLQALLGDKQVMHFDGHPDKSLVQEHYPLGHDCIIHHIRQLYEATKGNTILSDDELIHLYRILFIDPSLVSNRAQEVIFYLLGEILQDYYVMPYNLNMVVFFSIKLIPILQLIQFMADNTHKYGINQYFINDETYFKSHVLYFLTKNSYNDLDKFELFIRELDFILELDWEINAHITEIITHPQFTLLKNAILQSKKRCSLFNKYVKVIMADINPVNLLHFIEAIHQLNSNLTHYDISNKFEYRNTLTVCKLYNSKDLLNQKNYDLIINELTSKEALFINLITNYSQEEYPILNNYLAQIVRANNPMEVLSYLKTVHNLNPDIHHEHINNRMDFAVSLKLCKLFNAANLLTQEHYLLIIIYHITDVELLFKQILLTYIIGVLRQTRHQNLCYAELFQLAKREYLNDTPFIEWFDTIKVFTPLEIVEYSLLKSNQTPDSHFMDSLLRTLEQLPNKTFLNLFNQGVYTNHYPAFITHFTKLSTIELYDGGHSDDNWWKLTRQLLLRVNTPHCKEPSFLSLAEQIECPNADKVFRRLNTKIESHYWTFLRLQGRTILMINKMKDILSIKVQKKGESVEELKREYKVTSYIQLQAKKLDFKGQFAKPIGIVTLSNTFIKKCIRLNAKQFKASDFYSLTGFNEPGTKTAYLYRVNKAGHGYHTYLHDTVLSETEFTQSNNIAITNLSKLLNQGLIFDRLSDLFHNVISDLSPNPERPDKGRYIVLANLLAPTQFRVNTTRYGSGRVTAWQKAVQYPNLRLNQLADLGDCISFSDISLGGEWYNRYFNFLHLEYGDKASAFVLYNFMAEYLYVTLLIAGYRGDLLTKNKGIENPLLIWQSLAQQMFDNCVTMAFHLTHKTEYEIRDALSKLCNIKTLALQMQFWMTDDYVGYVKRNEIPVTIYGEDVSVDIDFERFRQGTFHKDKGCAINGIDVDLGTVNGQEPIKEANKLLYWTVSLIAAASLELDLILQDMLFIFYETDFQKSEALQQEAFTYIPTPSREKILATICTRQAQKTSNKEDAVLFENAGQKHERLYAAKTIQFFWRKKLERNKENRLNMQCK